MKRGAPLSRGSGLARGKPLARGDKPLSRGDKPLARAPMARTSAKPYPQCEHEGCANLATRKSGGPCPFHKEKPASTKPARPAKPGITTDTRAVVLARCGGLCEACGRDLERGGGVDLHHRQRRRGGDHSPANLVALHPSCHTIAPEAVHQRPEWARERGLIVLSTGDPASTPVVLPSGRRVLLHPVEPRYLAA